MKEELMSRVKTDLATVLADVQSYSSPKDMCNINPEKWMKIASMFVQGESSYLVGRETKCNGIVIKRVRSQLNENPLFCDLKREMAIEINMALTDTIEANQVFSEKLKNRIDGITDDEMEEMDILDLRKAESEGAKTAQLLTNTLLKLRGENVQKVHVVKTEGTIEDYFDALDKLNGNREKVVEAEEV